MRLGALLGPIGDAADARALPDQARALASGGYTSLWTAQALGRGFMMTDPFIAMTTAAVATGGVEIGCAVLQVPLYHPVDLAHRIFSLQQICGNRLILGVGAGSTGHDFSALGRDHSKRFRDFTVAMNTLRELLADGATTNAALNPWPSVRGGPPIFFGSWGAGVERAAKEFDGWIASGHYRTPEEVVAALARYRTAGGGRAIVSTIQLPAGTDLGELREKLELFDEAGFDDAVVMFLPGGPSIDEVRALVR